MNSFDLSIVSFINRFAQRSPTFDQLVVFLSISRLLKGGVIVGILWWVWFENDDVRRKRETLLAAIIASMPGLLIARVLSALIYRARPAVEPQLAFRLPYGMAAAGWQQVSSFPSDHALLFFALATGIFYASRRIGWFSLVYVSICICLPRLYLGEHYVTDIVAGAALGVVAVWAANRPALRRPLTSWASRWMDAKPSQFYCFAFLVTYQIAELFDPVIKIIEFIVYRRLRA